MAAVATKRDNACVNKGGVMNRKELIIVNSCLLGVVFLFSFLTLSLSINQSVSSLFGDMFKKDSDALAQVQKNQLVHCNKKAPLVFSDAEDDPYIVKLKEYQELCKSFVTDTLMIFVGFPTNEATARADAEAVAKKLTLFQQAGITPIVIAEPYTSDGLVPYRDFLNGRYDQALQLYFERLRELGISDEVMGTWVPFPESNTPSWDNKDTEPKDFALCVNKYLGALRMYFKNTKTSILLNATTYDPNDLEYNNGDYLDLSPYVKDIDKNLVTSLGIQGFPWVSNATVKRRAIFNATEFLQPDLAIAAARELHTRDIWFNTGSFASKYANDSKKKVGISTNDRKAVLSSILEVANGVQEYQQNGYRVSINMFSEDKSETPEATDWSYFQDIDSKTILKEFLAQASDQEIPISLYDRSKDK